MGQDVGDNAASAEQRSGPDRAASAGQRNGPDRAASAGQRSGPDRAGGEVAFRTEELLVERRTEEGGALYRFSGRARSSDPDFGDRLSELGDRIAGEGGPVSLDLAGLDQANSTFIGLVVRLVARLDEGGRRLSLVRPSRQVRDLLEIVGILGTLDVRDA